jgi:hypothetical protein
MLGEVRSFLRYRLWQIDVRGACESVVAILFNPQALEPKGAKDNQ